MKEHDSLLEKKKKELEKEIAQLEMEEWIEEQY